MNKKLWSLRLPVFAGIIALFFFIQGEAVAKKPVWDGTVHAPLKAAQ